MRVSTLLAILTLSCLSLQAQTSILWSDPVMVFDGTTYDNDHPRLAILGNGDPVMVWGSSTNDHVYFSRYEDGLFTEPVSLNTDAGAFAYSWAGPEIAAYGDTLYVVYKELPENSGSILLCRSFDGGVTWMDPVPVDAIPDKITNFPSVTVNSEGHPVIIFMVSNYDYSEAHYVTARSTDHGETFEPEELSSEYSGGEVCDCCTASIFSSGSRVVSIYRDNLENIRNMWAAVSDDDGATFPTGIQVDQTNWEVFVCPTSAPDGFIYGDSLYSFWMSNPVGQSLIWTSVSSLTDGADQPDVALTGYVDGLGVQNYPRVDEEGSAATLVWKQTTDEYHSMVMMQFTQDIQNGWEDPDTVIELSNMGIENADVAMDAFNIHVAWQDNHDKRLFYRQGVWNVAESIPVADTRTLHVWPVPASSDLHVSLPAELRYPASWEITDLTGHVISSGPVTQEETLNQDVRSFTAGAYWLRIKDETTVYQAAFMVH